MDNDEMLSTPIPPPGPDGALESIHIRDDGNELVEVKPGNGLHVDPIYHRRSVPHSSGTIQLRADVRAALVRVSAALPDGVDILVWDGLRSLETQAAIVEAFRAELPSGADQQAVVERYLAMPPDTEQQFRAVPPPHATGGAVDLTLCDTSGRALDLGADHDQFDEMSWLRAYEPAPDGSDRAGADDAPRRRRRRLLYWSMLAEGFSPYAWEYWHYELGTSVEAAFHGAGEARYGAATPWSGPA